MNAQLHCFGVTDIGCRRKRNEDQYLISGLTQSIVANAYRNRIDSDALVTHQTMLMAVADGLGGRDAGEIASEMAVDALGCFAQQHETNFRRNQAIELEELMRTGVQLAGQSIRQLAETRAYEKSMATTLTAALVRYPDLVVGHVGDSRCYLFRYGKLWQLTSDHTIAAHFRKQGELTEEQTKRSPLNHVLWNCLGGDDSLFKVETLHMRLEPNDWILLCTDGLIRHVTDLEISQLIHNSQSPRQLCKSLQTLAIQRGGDDNVTIVACNWEHPLETQPNTFAPVAEGYA